MFPLSCRRKPRSTRMQLVDSGTWWGRSSVITMLHTCRHTCSEASSPGSSRWLRCSPSGSPCSPSDPRCRTEVWWRRSRLRSPGRERYLQMMSWGRGWEIIWKCVLNDGNKMSNDDSPPELKNEESLPVRLLRTDSERQAVSCVRVDVVECFLHGQSEQNQLAEVMPAVLTVLREGDRSEASREKAERKQADVSLVMWGCFVYCEFIDRSLHIQPFQIKSLMIRRWTTASVLLEDFHEWINNQLQSSSCDLRCCVAHLSVRWEARGCHVRAADGFYLLHLLEETFIQQLHRHTGMIQLLTVNTETYWALKTHQIYKTINYMFWGVLNIFHPYDFLFLFFVRSVYWMFADVTAWHIKCKVGMMSVVWSTTSSLWPAQNPPSPSLAVKQKSTNKQIDI